MRFGISDFRWPLLWLLVAAVAHAAPPQRAPKPRPAPQSGPPAAARVQPRGYETPYYVILTDLDQRSVAEAIVRMTVLGEDLRRRTREMGFTGQIRQRLPFYLYRNRAAYLATGVPKESAGAFLGDHLVAAATDAKGGAAWHVVQHEAFHQFAAATTGQELPGWLSEGLGDYFGEALFTGDGYVTGVVPSWRLKRIQQSLRDGKFKPLNDLVVMPQAQWNQKVDMARYDQAWSLAQFLFHADGGKHNETLVSVVRALAANKTPEQSWRTSVADPAALERQWRDYWLALRDADTVEPYAEAAVATLASFLARAAAQGQSFPSFEAFSNALVKGDVRPPPVQWLPPSILAIAFDGLSKGGKWTLEGEAGNQRIVAKLSDGLTLVGRYTLTGQRVTNVHVERQNLKSQI